MLVRQQDLPFMPSHCFKQTVAIPDCPAGSSKHWLTFQYKITVIVDVWFQKKPLPQSKGLNIMDSGYCSWMIPLFRAYITSPAMLFAPVFVLSLSRIASTVLGLISTMSAISLVVFSSHINFKIVTSFYEK